MGEGGGRNKCQQNHRAVIGCAHRESNRREDRRKQRDDDDADAAGGECAQGCDTERGASAPLERHWMSVEADDDGTRLAGHVQHDRGRRPRVMRAVINAGQHDERRNGTQPERERQEESDRRGRAKARQYTDEGPCYDADEAVK